MTGLEGQFVIPMWYELVATFLMATTGALLAMHLHYDIVGVMAIALLAGGGGGLIRDGIFLQNGPPQLVENWQYLAVILGAVLVATFFYSLVKRFTLVFFLTDALALGLFSVVGAQMALNLGLSVIAAVLIGVVSAVGGGLMRDVITGRKPVALYPGQFYGGAVLLGLAVFLLLGIGLHVHAQQAALAAIFVTFVFRLLSIKLDWQSADMREFAEGNLVNRFTKRLRHPLQLFGGQDNQE